MLHNSLQIYTLGSFQVQMGANTLLARGAQPGRHWQFLAHVLAYHPNPLPREILQDVLWPERELLNPRHALNNVVYRLKKELERGGGDSRCRDYIQSMDDSYLLSVEPTLYLDIDDFVKNCEEARKLAQVYPLEALALYERVLPLYQGEFLPMLTPAPSLLLQRERYRTLYHMSLEHRLQLYNEQGKTSSPLPLLKE